MAWREHPNGVHNERSAPILKSDTIKKEDTKQEKHSVRAWNGPFLKNKKKQFGMCFDNFKCQCTLIGSQKPID